MLEASWPAWHVHSHHLHPSHPAGEASIRWHSERDHPLAARDRDGKPSLGRDHGLVSELERSPLHKMVRFLFRARELAPAQRDMRIPSLHHMLHAREARARTHARTAAHLIAFLCAVDRLCIPRTPQVITPRGFGARPSSLAFWILSAPAARAGGVNFARIGSSIARFCRGAFWKRHSRVNPWANRGL